MVVSFPLLPCLLTWLEATLYGFISSFSSKQRVFSPSFFLPRGGSEFFFFLDRGSIRIEEEFFSSERKRSYLLLVILFVPRGDVRIDVCKIEEDVNDELIKLMR